jgi:hypothetical protein
VLDTAHTHVYVATDLTFSYGTAGDTPLSGIFGSPGLWDIGVARPDTAMGEVAFILDTNGSHAFEPSDLTEFYGLPTDQPVVGDWQGSGRYSMGVFRQGTWVLDWNGNGSFDSGDKTCSFGQAGDVAVVGDWTGDGKSKIGVFRSGLWVLDANASCAYETSDPSFDFGGAGDVPVVGDWNGDRISDVGVTRPQGGVLDWYLDSNGTRVYDSGDEMFGFGLSTDRPVVGMW